MFVGSYETRGSDGVYRRGYRFDRWFRASGIVIVGNEARKQSPHGVPLYTMIGTIPFCYLHLQLDLIFITFLINSSTSRLEGCGKTSGIKNLVIYISGISSISICTRYSYQKRLL